MLEINGLSVSAEDKQILKGVDLRVEPGKRIVLMGPNGSGKSTICKSIMGDPSYRIMGGSITLDGEDITALPTNEKAKKRLFMIFQEPEEIEGLTASRFLRTTYSKLVGDMADFQKRLESAREELKLDKDILSKSLNVTASGGEKKKLEMLQMLMLRPKYALIDEFDSGLDVDSVKKISQLINTSEAGFLIVTHNPAVFKHLKIDAVNVIRDGRIIASGGREIVNRIEKEGFIWAD